MKMQIKDLLSYFVFVSLDDKIFPKRSAKELALIEEGSKTKRAELLEEQVFFP